LVLIFFDCVGLDYDLSGFKLRKTTKESNCSQKKSKNWEKINCNSILFTPIVFCFFLVCVCGVGEGCVECAVALLLWMLLSSLG